jgi:hypothetical protein
MGLVLVAVIIGGYVLLVVQARRARARRQAAAATVAFSVDDWGVRRTLADGRHEEVGWDELQKVEVVTLPKGPWGDPVRFVLYGAEELRGCIVPRPVAETEGLVPALTRLPGVTARELADVLETTPAPGTRVLWERAAPA